MGRLLGIIFGVFIFIFLIWGTAYFYSLGKVYETKSVPFFTDKLEIIAHRGGSLEMPENTLHAFDHAAQLGPDTILEFDVHLTSDKKPVVFHDILLNRTTNGEGPIHQKTLEELKKLDAGFNFKNEAGEFSMRGKGIQIPTLEEVLEKYPKHRMIIEVKPNSLDAAIAIYDVIAKYQRIDRTLLGSEHSNIIKYVKSKYPTLYTTAGKDEILRSVMLENMHLERLDSMLPDAFCIPVIHDGIKVLTDRLLTEIQRRGKKAFIWTINDKEEMKRLIQMGVNGIITDRPKLLAETLQAPSQN